MGVLEFVILFVVGLIPDWRPGTCDRAFSSDANREYCISRQENGYEKARELGTYFLVETARSLHGLGAERLEGLPDEEFTPELLPLVRDTLRSVSVGYRESSLRTHDFCEARIERRIITLLEDARPRGGEERWKVCFSYAGGTRETCHTVAPISEDEESVTVDLCAAGECGIFQLLSHEIRAGTIVPATGTELPRSLRERRNLCWDPQTNISLGMVTLAEDRDSCCLEEGDPEEGTAIYDTECQADWKKWIGRHNTGRCRGERFVGYGLRIERHVVDGLAYACLKAPYAPICTELQDLVEAETD